MSVGDKGDDADGIDEPDGTLDNESDRGRDAVGGEEGEDTESGFEAVEQSAEERDDGESVVEIADGRGLGPVDDLGILHVIDDDIATLRARIYRKTGGGG